MWRLEEKEPSLENRWSSVLKISMWGRGKITSKINHHHPLFLVLSGNAASETIASFCPEILQVGSPLPCGSSSVSGIELAGQSCILQRQGFWHLVDCNKCCFQEIFSN